MTTPEVSHEELEAHARALFASAEFKAWKAEVLERAEWKDDPKLPEHPS